jgi:uncharacterized protein
MLLRFRFANFRSFKDQQELSMIAGSYANNESNLILLDGLGLRAVKVAAIYGANASGKSNVLRAMGFMESAVRLSHRSWEPEAPVPFEPFLLDKDSRTTPSSFETDFVIADVRYQYGFRLTDKGISEEWLFAYPKGKRQTWFTRDASRKQQFQFGKALLGENKAVEAVTRKNSLFLSAAAQNNHELLSPLYRWFVRYVHLATLDNRPSRTNYTADMLELQPVRELLVALLRDADLGIVGADLRRVEYSAKEKEVLEALSKSVGAARDNLGTKSIVSLRHLATDVPLGIALPLDEESYGTQAFFALCGPVLDALAAGQTLLVDELDASLHTRLAMHIVNMFNTPELNKSNAQLIFNTHDTNLLTQDVLRRDQVWFTEKDEHGATHLYPLTDFHARKQENLERGYLQGRYGAVPFIDAHDFMKALSDGNG